MRSKYLHVIQKFHCVGVMEPPVDYCNGHAFAAEAGVMQQCPVKLVYLVERRAVKSS